MAIWTPKITHHQITLSPFSAEQMAEIGEVMANTIRSRIQSAINVKDQPAKPLVPKYAQRKVNRGTGTGRFPIRNWTFRDVTLKSIKVKSASEDRVTVGFVDPRAAQIVNGIARYDQMWGTSDKDAEKYYQTLSEKIRSSQMVRIVRGGQMVA